ncbi:hypothetical protein HBH44_144760 [Parastagonospora nodorum]|nr:hypothetical protein HBH45_049490 [Parastagonospora nodorum]KAH4154486.1 hypothetical protein HBH44_144760 [Parastagonospora nodorum]KAH4576191.1 hypothetical protein HBH84_070840 [Parastagonospora nodorum]KAH4677583.1 hypothetical protein HBH80_049830 [Parastagonospora nodorum]
MERVSDVKPSRFSLLATSSHSSKALAYSESYGYSNACGTSRRKSVTFCGRSRSALAFTTHSSDLGKLRGLVEFGLAASGAGF